MMILLYSYSSPLLSGNKLKGY